MSSPEELRAAFTTVKTERLLLRAVSAGDSDAVLAIHGNPRTYGFDPSAVMRSRAQAATRLAEWRREWRRVGFGFWAVRRHDDPEVIGFGGLSLRSLQGRDVLNTYYRFDPAAWGSGYATEMAATAVTLARRLLPEVPVIVRTRPENLAARHVAEKIGLARAPGLDDHLLTYVSDWATQRREGFGTRTNVQSHSRR
jgi:RimJ/RimL family protein N-acetyltransferase